MEKADIASADFLRELVERAYTSGNNALRARARSRSTHTSPKEQGDFEYTMPGARGPTPRAIPLQLFHRPYVLCLQTVEIEMAGYCVRRRFGWEKTDELAFSTRPPTWWRRIVQRPPLLSLRVHAGSHGATVSIGHAAPTERASGAFRIVRVDEQLQQRLKALGAQPQSPALKARLLAWLFGRSALRR